MLKAKLLNIFLTALTGIVVLLFVYLIIKLFPVYGAVFSFLWHIIAPFLIAGLIAYLLYPVVRKMHQYNMPKGLAVMVIYVIFFGGTAYLIYRIYPAIIHQLAELKNQLPQLLDMYRDFIYSLYEYTAFLPENVHDKMDELLRELESYVENLLTNLVRGFTKIFDMIILLTVIPVLVFYFLKDYTKMKDFLKKWVPGKYRDDVRQLAGELDDRLGGYFRGQLLVCLIVSLVSFALLYFLHINYALLLAIVIGITNIIPYFGPIIGALPVVAITAATAPDLLLIVIAGIAAIQVMEGNLLTPYVMGKSIQIHPAAIIFVLLVGGEMFGVVGMIIAVPVLTVLKVIFEHWNDAGRIH
ncbi:AI-2E family transporter [Virgibacillus siamensis]|uniref:AI-2E family transporter n=1 Tax=Virgibacillus siamensis TaxID=480071 RepID=UPI000984A3DD|nr:AI-2E family transporter [Virgibacillus siamensis]